MKNLIYIISLLFVTACSNTKQTDKEATTSQDSNTVILNEAQKANAGVKLGTPTEVVMNNTLKVFGVIDVPPQNMVSISLPLGGYLQSTQLLPGMHVGKGEVIAIVEDEKFVQLQQDYLAAKAKLSMNENEYNRQKELNKNKACSDKTLQQAEAEFTTQKILVKAISEKLKLISINANQLTENSLSRSIKIHSPIDGFVSKVNVNIGKYVNPSDVVFELVNPEDIHLNLKIFEKDIDKLSIGQTVMAYNNAQPELKHLCEIILISKDLGNDRSVEVHCHFEKYDKTLLPGMYMNAEIELAKRKTITLPSDAIVTYNDEQYVFTTKDGKRFTLLAIKTGMSSNGQTEIVFSSSPQASQQFVIQGAYSLLMQMKNTED